MSNVQRIKIPRSSDRIVADCFKELGSKYGVANYSISALAFAQIGNVNIEGDDNRDLKTLLEHNSTLIEVLSMRIAGLNISYHRGGQYPQEQKSPIFDEVLLNWNPQQGDLDNIQKLDIVAFINNKLNAFEPGRFVESGLSPEQNQLISIHQSTLERLEKLNEDLVRQSAEFRAGLERKFDEKSQALEDQTNAKTETLEEEHKKRTDDLNRKEKALADKLKAIDDRDNTHVRREIRDRMLSDVKNRIEQFGVSSSTGKKRRPVFFGMLSMVAAIATMLFYTSNELHDMLTAAVPDKSVASSTLYWMWGKISFLSVGLLGTILYYIKWQNRWAEQHAISEFQLQQFYIDVNRANWVIESCLEWRKVTESVIPTALLESITRNLFENSTEELEKVIHPSDELASALLGSASKLKMKVGDSEIEFDKPGKIKKQTSTR